MIQHAQLETLEGESVMLKGVTLAGTLQGALFEATVEQRFQNPGDTHVEVVYTFPVPHGAVLLGVAVKLGDRLLTGNVIARREAETRYEEALTEGDAAIMLERNADGTHTLNLGNLAPQEDCVVTVRYAQPLAFEQRGLRVLIPTVIAPRYGNPITDGGLQPHQVPETSLAADYPFDLRIDLLGELARARVSSPSHPIGVSHDFQDGPPRVRVTLAARASLDRDFILNLDSLPVNSLVALSADTVKSGQTAAIISLCPAVQMDDNPAMAVKLLVDCSGSMGGDSIAAGRRALQAIVGRLGDGDRFSLSRFGSTVEHRTRGLWSVKPATLRSAQRWISDLDADLGGTEMEAALASTFAIGHDEPGDVLLITDGEIHAIDALLATAARSGQRVFVVGIGSSPTEANLRRIAEVTGGACDFVAAGEQVEPAILRMFARLRSPRMDALAIHWPEGCQPVWHSPLPKSVFDADTLRLYALFNQPPRGELSLTGQRSRQDQPECLGRVSLSVAPGDGDIVPRLVAHERIKTLSAAEATSLAVAYQLITPWTNFLLVHERAAEDKAEDMPELHAVKQMLPAGWGGAGSVLSVDEPALMSGQASYGDMDSPVMHSRRGKRQASMSLEYQDIPAFLRRQADPAPGVGTRVREFFESRVSSTGASDSLDWENEVHGPHTPKDFLAYLMSIPQSAWPRTYGDLRDLGLEPEIIDWLGELFASEYPAPLAETVVIEAFLRALLEETVYRRIMKDEGPLQRLRHSLKQVFGHAPSPGETAHRQLVADLAAYMAGIAPNAWPEVMKAAPRTLS